MSGQSPYVKAIQRIANLAGELLAGRRALRFGANITVTDVPAGLVGSGAETITGYTLIEASGVLSTISGSGLIRITGTATDPVVEIGGGQAATGSGSSGAIYAESAAAGSDGDGGNLVLAGGDGHGTGTYGAVQVQHQGVTVLETTRIPLGGGQSVLRLGVSGGVAGLLVREDSIEFDFVYEALSTAGNGAPMSFTGQDASAGDGGSISFNSGAGGGGGDRGEIYFLVAGTQLLRLSKDKVVHLGDSSAVVPTVAIDSLLTTTVGAAGGAAALPATPESYLKIIDKNGATRLIPLYLPA